MNEMPIVMKNDEKLRKIKESLLGVMREPRRWLLLIGTGTSVAMHPELGMPALAKHLLSAIPKNTDGWDAIAEKLKQDIDLETALTEINPTISLQNEIAKQTAKFVSKKDAELRDEVLSGNKTWVGTSLVLQLMRGLSPVWPRLPIVTPNYDMLIEYACSIAKISYTTGYCGGIIRHQDWTKARERLCRLHPVSIGGKRRDTITTVPCVELMKVHGSINLFRSNNDETVFENDIWTTGWPEDDYTPLIAPPGDVKTQEALNFRGRLFGEAEQVIDKATAFFVIGYGFRDNHIHKKILERVRNDDCPLIVLTRDPSKELKPLPKLGKNAWVITGTQDQHTGKTNPSGTRFANNDAQLCGDFDGTTLWTCDVFVEQVLGA